MTTSIGVDYSRLSAMSFGTVNAPPLIGPLVISEVMYHPPGGLPGPESDYEFIELTNTGAAAVSLTGVRFADEVRYTFPVGESIAAGERVLVAANPAALPVVYSIPPGTRIFGPWAGSLDNSSGDLELFSSGATITELGPDFGYTPQYFIERVEYRDNLPWPASADGGGRSLQRTANSAYANDPASWLASSVTPGAATGASNLPPTIEITSPAPGATINLGAPVTITVSTSEPDDAVFSVEFFVNGVSLGTDTAAPFSFAWTPATAAAYSLTARARDGRLSTTTSPSRIVNVVNYAPSVVLTSPTHNSHFIHPASVTLTANASDPEGHLTLVEFFDNGANVGSDNAAPFSINYSPIAPGIHEIVARATDAQGVFSESTAARFTFARSSTIAYIVPAGTVGNQADFAGGLGHDFDVLKPIVITKLGVFDSGSNGLGTTLTVQLYARNNGGTPNVANDDSNAGLLETLTFSPTNSGTLVGGSRFRNLTTPRTLQPGSYTIASYGANASEPDGNAGFGTKPWYTDDGGSIAFVGPARYGGAVGTWPIQPDGGPSDRYAAGTFEFQSHDADGDGMPLDWEQSNGMNVNVADGNADADGDGETNVDEYLANTDPRSSASVFKITSITEPVPGVFSITFTARANRVFVVQRSSELQDWVNIHTEPAQGSTRVVTHVDAPPANERWFYRLKAIGP